MDNKADRIIENVYRMHTHESVESEWFIRDEEDIDTLLHVCEREIDPQGQADCVYLLYTESVYWDHVRGCYVCNGCKKEWQTEEELQDIWADGRGTGQEGTA